MIAGLMEIFLFLLSIRFFFQGWVIKLTVNLTLYIWSATWKFSLTTLSIDIDIQILLIGPMYLS